MRDRFIMGHANIINGECNPKRRMNLAKTQNTKEKAKEGIVGKLAQTVNERLAIQ